MGPATKTWCYSKSAAKDVQLEQYEQYEQYVQYEQTEQ